MGPGAHAFQFQLSNNGRFGIDRGAMGFGIYESEGAFQMERSATKRTGTHVVPQTYVVPTNEHEAAKAFSCVLLPFTRGELARAGKRGKDAAKRWKDGEVLPSFWTALNMAQEIPAVRNWMLGMLGVTDAREAVPPDAANALLGGLHFVAAIPGPDGAQARALLAKMGKLDG